MLYRSAGVCFERRLPSIRLASGQGPSVIFTLEFDTGKLGRNDRQSSVNWAVIGLSSQQVYWKPRQTFLWHCSFLREKKTALRTSDVCEKPAVLPSRPLSLSGPTVPAHLAGSQRSPFQFNKPVQAATTARCVPQRTRRIPSSLALSS